MTPIDLHPLGRSQQRKRVFDSSRGPKVSFPCLIVYSKGQGQYELFHNECVDVKLVVKLKRPLSPQSMQALEKHIRLSINLDEMGQADSKLLTEQNETDGIIQISVKNEVQTRRPSVLKSSPPKRAANQPRVMDTPPKPIKQNREVLSRTPDQRNTKTTPLKSRDETGRTSKQSSRKEESKQKSKTPTKQTTPTRKTEAPTRPTPDRGSAKSSAKSKETPSKPRVEKSPAKPIKAKVQPPGHVRPTTTQTEIKKSSERKSITAQASASQRPQKFMISSSSEEEHQSKKEERAGIPADVNDSENYKSTDPMKNDPNTVLPADVSFEIGVPSLDQKKSSTETHKREENKSEHPLIKVRVYETYPDGSTFEGDAFEGMPHGEGRMTYPSGGWFEGHWELGVMEGKGKMYYPSGDLAYEGDMRNDMFNGRGVLLNDLKNPASGTETEPIWVRYEGEFLDDTKHGFGVCYYIDGSRYEGHFIDDHYEGDGKLIDARGNVLSGIWENNQIVGAPN